MVSRFLLLLTFVFVLVLSAPGQCSPDRVSTRKYINSVYNNNTISLQKRISILEDYLLQMERCPNKNDSTQVFLIQSIGDLYSSIPNFAASAAYYHRSIDLLNTYPANTAVRQRSLVYAYYWLSVSYKLLDNVPEKMKAINHCIDNAVQLGMTSDINFIMALFERVNYDFDIGDYRQCIKDAEMCERSAHSYVTLSGLSDYDIEVGKSFALSSMGWYTEAQLQLKDYAAAENFLNQKIGEYKKSGLKNYLGYIYSQSAEIKIIKKDYTGAIDLFYRALQLYKFEGEYFSCKQVMNTMGKKIYAEKLKNSEKALTCFREALGYKIKDTIFRSKDQIESLNIFGNMANVFAQQKKYDSARYYFKLAFDQLKPGITEEAILLDKGVEIRKYPKVYYLENLFLDKADALRSQYELTKNPDDIKNAIRVYKRADELLDKIRAVQSDIGSKLFWRTDTRRLYDHAISACYLQKDATTAFYFFEKSRAVLLNDQLAQQNAMGRNNLLKQAPIRKRILALQQQLLATDTSSPTYTSLQSTLFAAQQELESITVLPPDKSVDAVAITLAGIKDTLLHGHDAVYEIFYGDSAIYVILITRSNTYFNKIDKSKLESVTSLYVAYLIDQNKLNRDFNGFKKTSGELYQLLFQDNPVPDGRIIISPDGPMFPFESLVTNSTGDDPVYFISNHATSYTYSARYLFADFAKSSTETANLLGIAPVQYARSFNLPSLEKSDESLQKIGSYFDYSSLIRKEASRENFLEQFPKYKIIQLYTHASDSSTRNEPVIYFADSALYLSELIREENPLTQLIVLSACETAKGQLHTGEGVFSFNRGFAALGIPSSISNLWAVDNLATYQLTEYFYKYLADGLPIDVALQKAKLEYLDKASENNKLPYYWAAPILIGKTDAIMIKKPGHWKNYLLIGIIAVIATLIVRFGKKKM